MYLQAQAQVPYDRQGQGLQAQDGFCQAPPAAHAQVIRRRPVSSALDGFLLRRSHVSFGKLPNLKYLLHKLTKCAIMKLRGS